MTTTTRRTFVGASAPGATVGIRRFWLASSGVAEMAIGVDVELFDHS
jgi:hypothetical protein